MTSTTPDQAGEIFLALGANIPGPAGPPYATLRAALAALAEREIAISRVSAFYETRAWPNPADPAFVNLVTAVRTALQPLALMTILHEVETSFGRTRSVPNAPRTLDIDLLDYGGLILDGPLVLPHPRIAERRFVLEPLAEIAPHWRHPKTGQGIEALLAG
jgi:2-amino-4-hydroxy-6-hydroxymethyldihydropteridine diphosphokinase